MTAFLCVIVKWCSVVCINKQHAFVMYCIKKNVIEYVYCKIYEFLSGI